MDLARPDKTRRDKARHAGMDAIATLAAVVLLLSSFAVSQPPAKTGQTPSGTTVMNQASDGPLGRQAAHLHALSSELKDEVDKTSPDVLSITVFRKAEAIEKLARSLKEEEKQPHAAEGRRP